LAFIGFMRLRVMAAELCRPFDEKRDGLLVGEGGVMFVLERESSAKARGAPIRARVLGAAVACENYHPTRPHPDGDGLGRATMEALNDAGLTPKDIDYICAHGTGTPQNDAIEVAVMQRCFPHGVAFSSIKALTGHPMGAAAAMEAAACILSLEQQTLIPTWHLDKVLQPCALDAVQDLAVVSAPRRRLGRWHSVQALNGLLTDAVRALLGAVVLGQKRILGEVPSREHLEAPESVLGGQRVPIHWRSDGPLRWILRVKLRSRSRSAIAGETASARPWGSRFVVRTHGRRSPHR